VTTLAATITATLDAITDTSKDDARLGAFAMRGRRQMEDDLSVEEETEEADHTKGPVPLTVNDSSTPHISAIDDHLDERRILSRNPGDYTPSCSIIWNWRSYRRRRIRTHGNLD
jgi:hypothetical protein